MIPSIEQICEDLAAGRVTVQQAIEWLYQHMQNADLRDTFATAALQGLIVSSGSSQGSVVFGKGPKSDNNHDIARVSYELADAMLAERAKA